jgi:glucoamylase
MPLVWAHAEYVKLFRSLRERRVWNMPPQTVQRYIIDRSTSRYQIWTPRQQRAFVDHGKDLRVDARDALAIRWNAHPSKDFDEIETIDSNLGVRWAVLPLAHLERGTRVRFQMRGADAPDSRCKTYVVEIR